MEQRADSLRPLVTGNVMGDRSCLQPGHPGSSPEAIRLSKNSQVCGIREPCFEPWLYHLLLTLSHNHL